MILISRRKTSPGTSPIREAVNKVTCSCTRPDGSFGRGPGEAGRAAQGSLAPPGRARQGSGTLCLLSSGWRPRPRVGLRSFAFLLPSLMLFFWGHPSHLRALFLLSPKVASSPSPPCVLRLSPNPRSRTSRTAVPVTRRLFAPAYFTHRPGHGWVGSLSEAFLKPLAEGTLVF